MQVYHVLSPQYGQPQRPLHKVTSMPTFLQDNHYDPNCSPPTSSSSCESLEEGYWRSASKWILRLRKKLNLSKSSIYLAISYLFKLTKLGFQLTQDNYQKVSAALILLSAKMNQIYPPKMSSLINRCTKQCTKQDLISIQGLILQYFNFDISWTEITYSYLARLLSRESESKLEDGQKLLGLAVSQKQIMKAGQQTIALGIVYLIKPCIVRDMGSQNLMRIKTVANKIYNLYNLTKTGKK